MQSEQWVEVCGIDDIDIEDIIPFNYGERSYAIYRSKEGKYFATDGYCTHKQVHLCNGLVIGDLIECPQHGGRLNYTTGKPVRKPICHAIETFPTKVEADKVYIQLTKEAGERASEIETF